MTDPKVSTFIKPQKANNDWAIPILAYILNNEIEGSKEIGVHIPREEFDRVATRPVCMEIKENGDIRVFLYPETK